MSKYILLGLTADVGNIKRVKVDNLNFESEIKELKNEASKQSEIPSNILELVHQGRVLDEQKTLKDYSVKCGDVVYVLKKCVESPKDGKTAKSQPTITDIHSVLLSQGVRLNSLTSFISNFENTFNPGNIDKFVSISPELEEDPVALSYMTAPELLFYLQHAEDLANVNKEHPVLAPAFIKICNTLLNVGGSSFLTSHLQQMIESEEEYEEGDLLEAEEYEDEDSDTQGERLITPHQLSEALAMARAVTSTGGSNTTAPGTSGGGASSSTSAANFDTGLREFLGSLLSSSDSGTPSHSGTPSRPIITRDMFSNALSQAMNTVTSTPPSSSSIDTTTEPSADPPAASTTTQENNFTEQLTRMQEMGLVNHRVNLRALIVSNGDVNSAINLVLSGAIDD